MSRSNLWLSILALLQIALVAFVFLSGARPRSVSTEAILGENFSSDAVTALTLTDEAGKLELIKKDGNWVYPQADDYPLDNGRVEALLNKLANLKPQGLIARNASSYKRLKVADDDFVTKLELSPQNQTLYLGSSPTSDTIHVRSSSAPDVFLSSSISSNDAPASIASWLDTTYLSLDLSSIKSLALENANGTFTFSKNEAGEWTMAGTETLGTENLDTNKISSFAGRLATLRMQAPLGKRAQDSYGLSKPQAILNLTTETVEAPEASGETEGESPTQTSKVASDESAETSEGPALEPITTSQTYTLEIGALLEDGYAVRSSASDYIVKVATSTLEDLVNFKQEDALKLPEEESSSQ